MRFKMKYIYSYTESIFALRELTRTGEPDITLLERVEKFLSSFSDVIVFRKSYVCPQDGYYCIGENIPKAFHGVDNPQFPEMIIITFKNNHTMNNKHNSLIKITMQDILNKINDLKNDYEIVEGSQQDFDSLIFQDFFFEEDNQKITATQDFKPTMEMIKPYLTYFELFKYKSSLKPSTDPVVKSNFSLNINSG